MQNKRANGNVYTCVWVFEGKIMFFVSEDISTRSTQRSSAAEMDGILSKLRSANSPRAGARPASVKHFVIKCSYTEVHEPSWPPDEIFLVVGSYV